MIHKKIIFSKDKKKQKPAIFCDRDGVIIKDCNYISNPNDVSILKGTKELLNFANKLNWHFIIITNQSDTKRYSRLTMKLLL